MAGEDFEKLEQLWADYAKLKTSMASSELLAHSARSSSTWSLTQLSQYLPEFWVLSWCSKTSTQRRRLDCLEAFLKESSQIDGQSIGCSGKACQDAEWRKRLLQDLEEVLRVLGCPEAARSSRAPFRRLGGLAKLNAKEAASRSVIDKLIFPLCAELDVEVSLEEYLRNSPVPISICDYVLRRKGGGQAGQVLGALEAKRCSDGGQLLGQGAAQCILQLLALWADRSRCPAQTSEAEVV